MDRQILTPIIVALILIVFIVPIGITLLASNMDGWNIIVKGVMIIGIPTMFLIAVLIVFIPKTRK
jgi:hypothetical protein